MCTRGSTGVLRGKQWSLMATVDSATVTSTMTRTGVHNGQGSGVMVDMAWEGKGAADVVGVERGSV